MTESVARPQLSDDQVAAAQELADELVRGATRPQDREYVQVDGESIPQFSKKRGRKRVRFMLDDDVFEGYNSLDVDTAMSMADKEDQWSRAETAEEAKKVLRELFELCLKPESYVRFEARLGDRENPVDVQELPDIITYLMEAFGLRPTRPSPDSSGTPESPDAGTSSTDGQLSPASTSSPSPSTGS